jgi:hypothetical protein
MQFNCVKKKVVPLKQKGEILKYYKVIQKKMEHVNKLEIGYSRFLATTE